MTRRALLAHLETMRPYTIFYVGLVALAGALLANPHPTWLRLAAAVLAPILGWTAGLYGGDYFDRRLDSIAKPQRPIPSGRISPATALAFMVGYVTVGLIASAWLSVANLVVALAVLGLEIAYSKVLKAHGVLGHFVRGLPMSLTLVFGSLAVSGQFTYSLVPACAAFFLHDAFTNMIGAIRDMDGDRAGGYMTFPARYGIRATLGVGSCLYGCGVVLIGACITNDKSSPWNSSEALLFVASAIGAVALWGLWRDQASLSRQKALWAHKALVLERLCFASALIASIAGFTWTMVVLVPATFLTWLAQTILRDRYEFVSNQSVAQHTHSRVSIGARSDSHLDGSKSGRDNKPIWSRLEALSYLRRQLASMNQLPSLRGWPRRLQIRLDDLDVVLCLVNNGTGEIGEVDSVAYNACSYPEVSIGTELSTFLATFVDRSISPVAAYRKGLVRLSCSPLDMVRLNNVMRALQSANIPSATRPAFSIVSLSSDEPKPGADANNKDELKHPVVIADTTLRDGEQMPGVAFSVSEKIAIATMLDSLHVPLIEVGFPIVSEQECQAIQEIVRLGLRAAVQVIARPTERDIDAAVQTGASSIAIFIGTSESHIVNKLRTTRAQVLEGVAHAIEYAKQAKLQIVFAPEDATRTPWDFLVEVSKTAVDAGADVLGIPDTAGIMTPCRMFNLVHALARSVPVPIAVHCHNDLGLATANSIAGLLAGASGAQCSLLGIGERSGNAALEEVVTTLEVAYGCHTGIDLTQLSSVAQKLYRILGWREAPHKAVIGDNAFVHESGLHADGIVRDPSTYEAYLPERVGQSRRFVFGKHSGRSSIRHILGTRGIPYDEQLGAQLLAVAKQFGEAKHPLDEEALVQLALEKARIEAISTNFPAAPIEGSA